jgi:hypothetical protein
VSDFEGERSMLIAFLIFPVGLLIGLAIGLWCRFRKATGAA